MSDIATFELQATPETDKRGVCSSAPLCSAPLRFAYADPPYLGQGKKHYAPHHENASDCDALEWHAALIKRLCAEYPDGWALSLNTPSLRELLPLCPLDVRVGAWCKSFCSFKPNVNPAYAWEPVIWRGGRKRQRWDYKVRDYAVIPITLKQGFPGAKPAKFMRWVLELLNAEKTDTIDDLFPGSGACTRAVEAWKTERTLWEQNAPHERPPLARTYE